VTYDPGTPARAELADVRAVLTNARSVEELIDAVAIHLKALIIGLNRVSLRVLAEGDPSRLELTAVWTPAATDLKIGLRMPIAATAYPEIMRTRNAVTEDDIDPNKHPIDRLLAGDNVRSFTTLAVTRGERLVGLLSVCSSRPASFPPQVVDALVKVAAVVSDQLATLSPAQHPNAAP
jgi:GAF domain-containing protein